MANKICAVVTYTGVVLLVLTFLYQCFVAVYGTVSFSHHWKELSESCDPLHGFAMFGLIWMWIKLAGLVLANRANEIDKDNVSPVGVIFVFALLAVSIVFTVFFVNRDDQCSHLLDEHSATLCTTL